MRDSIKEIVNNRKMTLTTSSGDQHIDDRYVGSDVLDAVDGINAETSQTGLLQNLRAVLQLG